jgi:hypothetical protein
MQLTKRTSSMASSNPADLYTCVNVMVNDYVLEVQSA